MVRRHHNMGLASVGGIIFQAARKPSVGGMPLAPVRQAEPAGGNPWKWREQLSSSSLAVPPVPRPAEVGRRANRALRVVFCCDNLGIGGTELNAARTAERLARDYGVSVDVVLLGADGPLRARYEAAGITVHPFSIPNLYGPAAIREGIRFARFLRERRIDVLHCHDMYSNVFGAVWGRAAGVRRIIASRRWWASLPQAKLRVANRIAYRLAHAVLANSETVGRSLVESDGVRASKIGVVTNFLEPAAFAFPGDAVRAAARAELGLAPGDRVIGIVARLDPVKDHATLLRAFAALEHDALRLLLIGDGPCRASLEQLARELGCAERVCFAGTRPNRPNLHFLSDIAVLSSKSEGFPNSLAEAMAAGRPVVSTDVGGVADAVVEGETGLLVPPGNASALAAALTTLLDDPLMARRFGLAGESRARRLFGEPTVLPTLLALYEGPVRP